ncbi:apoptosis-associated speck-like protein containing a CARD [Esox lucius]|uniref:Apoptosis-associated speck-like protein containing a CARD n=1 Tax=Esox lucius TaxID=8010 RepID=C1BXR4_ESOLU|nr:apoptosis-associated speck-like protein containing a CARD [Esox lucius]ACO13817.1 Apoptosis-associated speck-like protein containing a CARD [Esox lucius]
MSKTVSDAIINVLDGLGEAGLKRFRRKLCDCKRDQGPVIRFGKVEKADADDLVLILIRTYTENGALDVAIEVLEAIGDKESAEELMDFQKSRNKSPGPSVPGDPGQHFVDLYRKDLIERVSQVDPILDSLLQRKVIQQSAYSDVRSERTSQKRMRELYEGPVKGFGVSGKDIFLEILTEHEPYLISDLKGEK